MLESVLLIAGPLSVRILSAFASTESARFESVCTLSSRLCNCEASAMIVGGSPFSPVERRRVARTADQGDRRGAGQSLHLEPGARVFLDRGATVDVDRRDDLARVSLVEIDLDDFAHFQAIEQDIAAGRQTGHGPREDDAIGLLGGQLRQTGEPHDEQKRARDHRQGESANQYEIGPRLHLFLRLVASFAPQFERPLPRLAPPTSARTRPTAYPRRPCFGFASGAAPRLIPLFP